MNFRVKVEVMMKLQSNCLSSCEGQDEDLVRLRFQPGSLSVRVKVKV